MPMNRLHQPLWSYSSSDLPPLQLMIRFYPTNHGPLAEEALFKQVQAYIESGKKSDKISLGTEKIDQYNGFFVRHTVFLETQEDAKVMKEEIFDMRLISTPSWMKTRWLQMRTTLIYTKDINRAMRIATKLEPGTVGVNCTSPTTAHDLTFGGYKSSGLGREGWTVSLNNFLETKSVLIKVDNA
ncbi:hypothetical protein N7449_009437 [Penicillium cf. viridicatum]|uniref:aldehyde dehydrogenase (NAD(+)) n=1 Tax=Penicillium cf. viridicatum TaxID=2972119 RepID=A0A9W9JAD3_9EURO|nr:hypothetical protein N7449_009437 [Penicillium cf. viridicatum]